MLVTFCSSTGWLEPYKPVNLLSRNGQHSMLRDETGDKTKSPLLWINGWKGCIFNICPRPCSLKGTAIPSAQVSRRRAYRTCIYIYINAFSWCTFLTHNVSDSASWECETFDVKVRENMDKTDLRNTLRVDKIFLFWVGQHRSRVITSSATEGTLSGTFQITIRE